MTDAQQAAWSAYWSAQAIGAHACLPHAPHAAQALIEARWRSFFEALPQGASVLDLGCGAGAVARLGLTLRADLEFTGVDYADSLPPSFRGLTFHPRVRLEALPFGDSAFHAVTSQFALEYADTSAALAELARVLASGGAAMLLMHHADSMIVTHNRSRLHALRDILGCVTVGAPDRVQLCRLLIDLQAHHPAQSVVTEVATAIDRNADLELLSTRMAGEIARLAALSGAAMNSVEVEGLTNHANGLGLCAAVEVLATPGAPPLAWCFTLNR